MSTFTADYLNPLAIAVERHLGLKSGTILIPEFVGDTDSKTSTWRFTSQGEDGNVVYVRVNGARNGVLVKSPEAFKAIAEAQEYLRAHTRLPIAKVIACDVLQAPHQNRQYIIVEQAPGQMLHKAWPHLSDPAKERFVKDMADLLSQLSKTPLPVAGSFLDVHIERRTLDDERELAKDKTLIDLFERLKSTYPSAYVIMTYVQDFVIAQSDYQSGNLLVDPDSGALTGFIDFALVRLVPQYFDLASPEWLVDAVEDEPGMPLLPPQSWTWTNQYFGERALSKELGQVFREEFERLQPGSNAILKQTRPFREWCRAVFWTGWGNAPAVVTAWAVDMHKWLDAQEKLLRVETRRHITQ